MQKAFGLLFASLLNLFVQEAGAQSLYGERTAEPYEGAPLLESLGLVEVNSAGLRPISSTVVHPEDYGAAGDGVHNDRDALQAAVRACSNCTVQLAPSAWYRIQSDKPDALTLDVPGVRLRGNGDDGGLYVVLTDKQADCGLEFPGCEQRNGQAIHLLAANTSVEYVAITSNVRSRGAGNPQGAAIWLDGVGGHEVRAVRLEYGGVHATGGLANAVIGNAIWHNYADGIHITDLGPEDTKRSGALRANQNDIKNCGDDGIAIVDRGAANLVNYDISDNRVTDGYWGRGIAVDGGSSVMIRRNTILSISNGAGILVHSSKPWNAAPVKDIQIRDNKLFSIQTGEPPHTGHSAIDIFGENNPVSNVTLEVNYVYGSRFGVIRTQGVTTGIRVSRLHAFDSPRLWTGVFNHCYAGTIDGMVVPCT